MNEEITEKLPERDMLRDYKKTALLVGLYLFICFALRYACGFVQYSYVDAVCDSIPFSDMYSIELLISGAFLQVIPSVIGAFMFGYIGRSDKRISDLYHRRKNLGKAVSNVAAVYGLAQIVNIITLVIIFLFTSKADIGKQLNTTIEQMPFDTKTSLVMFFMLVVIAPVFEEFMFRGIVLGALKPYGNGLAIIVSGLAFGLFHGNLRQFFYTTVFGIALGYIACVTDSILPTMIIHAITNSIAGFMLLLMANPSVQTYILSGSPEEIPEEEMLAVAVYGIYMVCLLIFAIVGFIAAIAKIKKMKKYKVEKVWGEVPNGRKALMLVLTVPFLLMLVLAADTFFGISGTFIPWLK